MVLGIAGGVGSGKSTVLNILQEEYDVCICMADELGHEAMCRGTTAYRQIIETFGAEICLETGEIDRRTLAEKVYCDETLLQKLNGIIHPFVKKEICRRIEACEKDKVFVLETAILFESGCDEFCDSVWGVITQDDIRIRRLMASRGYTEEKAQSIMNNQYTNKELAEKCEVLLRNDGDMGELRKQIHRTMENLLANISKL